MKQIMITSNTSKGENIFHCWNATLSFYVYTQNGKRGIDAAYAAINKKEREDWSPITMSIAHCAPKDSIHYWFK